MLALWCSGSYEGWSATISSSCQCSFFALRMQFLIVANAVPDYCTCSFRVLQTQLAIKLLKYALLQMQFPIVANAVSDCCKCSFRLLHMQFPSVATAMLQLQFLVRLSPLPLSRAPSHADSDAATPKSAGMAPVCGCSASIFFTCSIYRCVVADIFPNRRPHQPITS